MNTMRKGQIKEVAKGAALNGVEFMHQIFGSGYNQSQYVFVLNVSQHNRLVSL